jgi:radical SAM protein with 4Fe4S-binding SPASM domain
MAFEGFPLVVGWELTLACNLRCSHCASSAGTPRPDELTLDEALALCDQFPALLVREVDFTGGEPLLRQDWPQIAARLREFRIPMRVVTNGLLLEESAPQLKEAGIDTVGVSVDGLEPTHDHIRCRPGLFAKVRAGIEAAVSAGLPVAAITAVNAVNLGELPQLAALLTDLGIAFWQVQPTFPFGRAREGAGLHLTSDHYLQLGEFVAHHRRTCGPGGLDLNPADGLGYYSDLDTRDRQWTGCCAGRAACGITSDGKVKGCLSMPDECIEGDLRERDLWDIWFDPRSFAYNREFGPGDLGEFCSGCEKGEDCMGGCCAMSLAGTGRFHNAPYCFLRLQRPSQPLT